MSKAKDNTRTVIPWIHKGKYSVDKNGVVTFFANGNRVKVSTDIDGDRYVTLSSGYKKNPHKKHFIATLVAATFKSKHYRSLPIYHKDGNKENYELDNLSTENIKEEATEWRLDKEDADSLNKTLGLKPKRPSINADMMKLLAMRP